MIRFRWAAVLVVVTVGACGGQEEADLAFSLAPTTYVVGVPSSDIEPLGEDLVSGGVDLGGNPVAQQQLLVYRHQDRRQVAVPFPAEALENPFRFWREPRFQADLEVMSRSGPEIILFLQQQTSSSETGVDLSAQMVVLDTSGAVVASDWDGTLGAAEVQSLVEYMGDNGIDLVEGFAAFVSAAADDELGRPVSDPLGAELLEVVRG